MAVAMAAARQLDPLRGTFMITIDFERTQKHFAFGLIGIDSLPLFFPPGGGPA